MAFIPLPDVINNIDKRKANFALQFNKWVNFGGNYTNPKELKEDKSKELVRLKNDYDLKRTELQETAEARQERIMSLLGTLVANGFSAAILTCKVNDSLVCGIGDEHPLENSLRFDHCTGLPYVPASSIKGVARFTAEYDMETDEPGKNMETGLFGSEGSRGSVQFWDGFPTTVPELKIDIMNNHFQEYYTDDSGQIAPSDDMNPVPIFFMVVASASQFSFPVVARKDGDLSRAVEFLKQALSEWGVGAKTSLGYGMFSDFSVEVVEPLKPAPVQRPERPCEKALPIL